ncbi:MAG: hypothetical protein HZB25_11765 [Candidatus Eisenbacteria bacterium]|nr:hypothetical protein [Candidatus Eisenbacteria bacterium]
MRTIRLLPVLLLTLALTTLPGAAPGAAAAARQNRISIVPGGPHVPPAALAPDLRRLAERRQLMEQVRMVAGDLPVPAPGSLDPLARARRARSLGAERFTAAHPETIRVLGLRVDFLRDSVEAQTTGNGRFDLEPDSTVVIDPPPHDRNYFMAHMKALSNFYRAQSYGSVVITYDVYPKSDTGAYHLRDVADYGPWEFSQDIVPQIHRYVRDAMHRASEDPDIHWKRFDRIIIFHAGADFQTDVRQNSAYDIPSLTFFMDSSNAVRVYDRASSDTLWVFHTTLIPESSSQDGLIGAINGVMAHEFGHLLRANGPIIQPDLYNTSSGMPAVGTWSLHDSGNFLGTRVGTPDGEIYAVGLVPGSDDVWSKWVALYPDAMRPVEFEGPDTTVTLRAAENDPGFVYLPVSQDEYFLLENRQQEPDAAPGDTLFLKSDSLSGVVLGPARKRIAGGDTTVVLTNEFDVLQPASGILCFHVDNSVLDLRGVNVPADSGFNTNPRRLSIALIQGDGSQSLGDGGSPYYQGGPFDPFAVGNFGASLPEDGRPSSRGNSGGLTGVSFEVLDPPGPAMRVRIRRSRAIAGWPVPTFYEDYFEPGAAAAADLNGDGRQEYYAAARHGRILGYTRFGRPVPDVEGNFPLADRPFEFEPELLTMPGWGPNGRDAIVGEWRDSSIAGTPRSLAAYDINGPMENFPAGPVGLTTPPVRYGDKVLAGGADGNVWMFEKTGTATPIGSAIDASNGGRAIQGRLLVGKYGPGGTDAVIAANSSGGYTAGFRVLSLAGLGSGTPPASPAASQTPPTPPPLPPLPEGSRFHRPVLLGAYADTSATAEPVVIVVDSTGWIGAFRLSANPPGGWNWNCSVADCPWVSAYNLLPGFPCRLPSPPAGIATLGDISGDGRPCVLVQCQDGKLYAVGMDGRPLPGFPARLPEGRAPVPGSAALQYRTLAGEPRILVATTSGDLVGVNPAGKVVQGFPRAVAGDWGTGCFFVPGERGNTWLLAIGGGGGWSLDSLPGVPRGNWVSGGPGVDEARTGFLPRTRMGPPRPVSQYADLGNFRAYPNPLRIAQQNELRVSFELTRSAPVRVRLFDLKGRIVSQAWWQGHPAVNVVALPASQVGSGLYHVEVTVEGTALRMVTPVAVVR